MMVVAAWTGQTEGVIESLRFGVHLTELCGKSGENLDFRVARVV